MKSRRGLRAALRRAGVASVAICALTLVLAPGPAPARAGASLTPEQLLVMRQLVSVYENTTTQPRYSYVQDLHDGCGYTAGWVGFCTEAGDLLEVVNHYDALAANNPLRR